MISSSFFIWVSLGVGVATMICSLVNHVKRLLSAYGNGITHRFDDCLHELSFIKVINKDHRFFPSTMVVNMYSIFNNKSIMAFRILCFYDMLCFLDLK